MSDAPRDQPLPESDRTVVRPRPGARSAVAGAAAVPPGSQPIPAPQAGNEAPAWPNPGAARSASPAPASAFDPAASGPIEPLPGVGENPIVRAAQPLLALIASIRESTTQADPNALKESLSRGVQQFETAAAQAGVPRESIIAARYTLCTFLDESAASTPWGGGGVWTGETLLMRFHNEAWGGEKVFMLLSRLAEAPAKNRDLLELVYLCLALGFQGRYALIENGRAQLDQVRERLHQMLRGVIPAPERSLSVRWAPAVVRARSFLSGAPFWAFCAAIALLAAGLFLTYDFLLGSRSDKAFAAIAGLRLPNAAPLPPPAPPPPAQARRLSRFLEREIAEGLVTVRDEAGKSVVSIRGDGFFEPGSAVISPRVMPILERIAQGLVANPGRVLVVGHSDNQPIASARYPSNWHLSQERARAVLNTLAVSVPADRMQAEGRADAEPLAPNDTPAGRARNRRVDVTLFVAAGG